jgi:glycosyltransferase involved in cell wall biosynthesis
MLPSFGGKLRRKINLSLLQRNLHEVLHGGTATAAPEAVITTAPVLGDLVSVTRQLPWVYYCADDYAAWPGADGRAIRRLERVLLEHATHIIVASEFMRAKIARFGRTAELITHGVDLGFWKVARTPSRGARPVAMYWGSVDRRLHAPSCLALADVARLLLVGERCSHDPSLRTHPSIAFHGKVDVTKLPALAAQADLLVMPFADTDATRAMQPLKMKEYLATGLPVLAPPLPAVREWGRAMDICRQPADYARLALKRWTGALPASQVRARERLRTEDWESKAREFEQVVSISACRMTINGHRETRPVKAPR